jgi:hypothetical protein
VLVNPIEHLLRGNNFLQLRQVGRRRNAQLLRHLIHQGDHLGDLVLGQQAHLQVQVGMALRQADIRF